MRRLDLISDIPFCVKGRRVESGLVDIHSLSQFGLLIRYRHAHAVWSRIEADTMTAKNLPFFKNRMREISKELFMENDWTMPRGLMDSEARDLCIGARHH
ncbi:MAG: hypothetical protein RIB80_09865 [Rhodospirillales bacterium]